MVFGTFDLFHPGHVYYISEAFSRVENLIVIIARDNRVQSGKGIVPHHNENNRREIVEKFLNTISKKKSENSKKNSECSAPLE